jgi:gluconolactonase
MAQSIQFETYARELVFTEGPLVLPGGAIGCVEVLAGRLTRIGPNGEGQAIAQLGGGPNGAALGPDGRVYVCNNGGLTAEDIENLRARREPTSAAAPLGSIQVVDLATGAFKTLYAHCDGVKLVAPNDLVFDHLGGFYFTDYGSLKILGPQPSRVYYAAADGSSVTLVVDGMERTNGVGLSPNDDWLYVAETAKGKLSGFPIVAPGKVDRARQAVLHEEAGLHLDSLAVQADGRVCVACPSADIILRAGHDGKSERISTGPGGLNGPAGPTNICFSGADGCDAYVTAAYVGEVRKARWDTPGLRLPFEPD